MSVVMKYGRQKEKERKIEVIHRTAARILCNLGYEKASIRDIAEATGITKAGLYYYFDTKEELLYQILDSFMDDLLAEMRDLHARITDPAELIQAIINLQVQRYCRDKHRSKLIAHDENCLSGKLHKQLKEKQQQYFSYWREAVRKYCEQKGLSCDHVAVDAHTLMGACIWVQQWYNPSGEVKPDQLVRRIFSVFLYGLSSRDKIDSPQESTSGE